MDAKKCADGSDPVDGKCADAAAAKAKVTKDAAKMTKEVGAAVNNTDNQIKADKKKIKQHLDNSLMMVTALAPYIGYDNAAKIAKNALKNNTTLKEEALKSKLIKSTEYDKIVDPKKMITPN